MKDTVFIIWPLFHSLSWCQFRLHSNNYPLFVIQSLIAVFFFLFFFFFLHLSALFSSITSNMLFSHPLLGLCWCWCSRTDKTYAFIPRVGWAGAQRISVGGLWGSRAPLHATVATGAWQHWRAPASVLHTLPVQTTGQVRFGGCTQHTQRLRICFCGDY